MQLETQKAFRPVSSKHLSSRRMRDFFTYLFSCFSVNVVDTQANTVTEQHTYPSCTAEQGGSISNASDLTIGRNIDYSDRGFSLYPQSFTANVTILSLNRPRPLLSTSFPIYHSLSVLSCDAL
jgi:hypothetical protein